MRNQQATRSEPTIELPMTARRRDVMPSRAEVVIATRVETSAAAADRLRETLRRGRQEFVLTSRDGAISALVRLSPSEASTSEHRLAGHTVTIDWTHATVANGRSCMTISRTELRLLAALLAGRGAPVSRRELIQRVWPDGSLGVAARENALAVYVCTLRKRLASIGVGSAVGTVRGKGYLLNP